MPIRRNECAACGREFRVLEAIGEKGRTVCPSCGSHETRRLLPHVSLQFKGSGFYRTDHGRGNGNGSKPAGEAEAATATSLDDD